MMERVSFPLPPLPSLPSVLLSFPLPSLRVYSLLPFHSRRILSSVTPSPIVAAAPQVRVHAASRQKKKTFSMYDEGCADGIFIRLVEGVDNFYFEVVPGQEESEACPWQS